MAMTETATETPPLDADGFTPDETATLRTLAALLSNLRDQEQRIRRCRRTGAPNDHRNNARDLDRNLDAQSSIRGTVRLLRQEARDRSSSES